MAKRFVTIETNERIAVVRINSSSKKNALNLDVINELFETAIILEKSTDIDVVVLTGDPEGFCAGADLDDSRLFASKTPLYEQWRNAENNAKTGRAWAKLPQPCIVAIEGFVIGAGFSLSMACDFRVMGRSAFISIPEVDLGFNYGWNSIPQLVSLVGPAKTKRMVLLGEKIGAEQAEQWGLIDYLTEDGGAEEFAMTMAETLSLKPALAVQLSKKAIDVCADALVDISSHADMSQILFCQQSKLED